MKKKLLFITSFFLTMALTGCGKDAKLSAFEENMNGFKNNITEISSTMDGIDPNSETAVDDMLLCLDQMNEQFAILAEMEVPDKFSNIEELADEAGSYMNEAVSLYHEAYANDTIDDIKTETAAENYSRAMKRITYISELLQGKIPDGTDVTLMTDESNVDFEPITEE